MFRIVSIILAGFLVAESFYYSGVFSGYAWAASELAKICHPTIDGLCISGGDPYVQLINLHVGFNLVLIIYIGFKLLKTDKVFVMEILSIGMLILCCALFVYILLIKNDYYSDPDQYIEPIRQTYFVSVVHLLGSFALLALDLAATNVRRRGDVGVSDGV